MKLTAIIVSLVLVLSSATVRAADTGLIAHWDFNEGSGTVLHDRSGNGIDGEIKSAEWVKGRVDGALAFNGVDSQVALKQDDRLNLQHDASISIWFRTQPTKELARDQLLFGDTASRTVWRNLSIVIDQGKLLLSNADGVTADTISPTVEFAGNWTHLVAIYEYPNAYLYINGKLVEAREMSVPLTQTKGGQRFIGGWWAGHLKGEIDDVKIYSRAISENEVLKEFDPKSAAAVPSGSVTPRLSISKKHADLNISCRNLTKAQAAGSEVTVEIFKPGDLAANRAAMERKQAKLVATRESSERYNAVVPVDFKNRPWGEYDVRLSLVTRGTGVSTALGSAKIYLDQPPAWWGNRLGITSTVPPPFTPVAVKQDGKSIQVGVTQREYRSSDKDILTQITARGEEMLAGPVRLVANVDGRECQWKAKDIHVDSTAADGVAYSQSVEAGGLNVGIKTRTEYDGFAKLALELKSSSAIQLNSLAIEIPLKASSAAYLFAWAENVRASGARPDKVSMAFAPIVWLGNDDHGLSWFCETDQNWKLEKPDDAIQIETRGDQAIVRLNLVGTTTRIAPGKPLTYAFGYQATPLRPKEGDCWDYRITSTPDYGFDYDLLTKDLQGKKSGEWLKQNGFRTLLACNWTSALAYPMPLGKEKEFKDLVALCHDNGLKIIPYLGYQINTLAPEFRSMRDEVVRLPLMQNPDKYPGMTESQTVAAVTLSSVWQDALVYYVDKMMRDYKIDGIYLDSTCMPFGSVNTLAGDGYVDESGKLKPTYPVFAVRETFKRLYNVVKQHKPDGYVDTHVYDCMNSAALAFSTSYWNGEQLSPAANDVSQALPVDRFRAEMMGFNWGVPADFLYYKLGDFKKAHAVSLIHDVAVRSNDLWQKEINAAIWKLMDKFDRNGATFLPYWKNEKKVTVAQAGTYASAYVHPRNGVLVIVSNLNPTKSKVTVTLDPAMLVPGKNAFAAVDGLTGSTIDFGANKFEVELDPMGWQYIWLQPK